MLLQQDHPNFEIILINDASVDDTAEVIEHFERSYANIHKVNVVNNETFWGNKKYALTLGIKKAAYNNLVFIDADCRPASNSWLRLLSEPLQADVSIVLGYGAYQKVKKSFLNQLIRYETATAAMQYMSYALRGNAYMGVGRNLSYTARQFYDVSGYISHMKVMGGDDDLFVNEAATPNNTTVVLSPESFTLSQAKSSWHSWWTQKKRHVNTAKHYKRKHQLSLGLYFISQLLFFIAATLGFILGAQWQAILALVVIRYIVVFVVVGKSLIRFRESELAPFIPILEIVLLGSQLGLFFSNIVHPPKRWK